MLPEFVGMSVIGKQDVYQADLAAIAGVMYVRRFEVDLETSEFYVAAEPDKTDAVIDRIKALAGVVTVQVTSLRHK